MSQKLKNAPVYFTIMQARFNPIMKLDPYAPTIQDQFRVAGFPDWSTAYLATINLNVTPSVDLGQQVPLIQSPRFIFKNMEQNTAFLLDQGALTLQTTEYETFEEYSEIFKMGLNAVNHAVGGLAYTDRVGFRYLDAVLPRKDESVRDYLDASMLGFAHKLDEGLAYAFSESRFEQRDVNIVARTVVERGELGFPPDLQPNFMTVADRFRGDHGVHAILDMDGSFDGRETFAIDRVMAHLTDIHDEIAGAFKAIVLPHAIKVWGGE